jgi:hypothetical protein
MGDMGYANRTKHREKHRKKRGKGETTGKRVLRTSFVVFHRSFTLLLAPNHQGLRGVIVSSIYCIFYSSSYVAAISGVQSYVPRSLLRFCAGNSVYTPLSCSATAIVYDTSYRASHAGFFYLYLASPPQFCGVRWPASTVKDAYTYIEKGGPAAAGSAVK